MALQLMELARGALLAKSDIPASVCIKLNSDDEAEACSAATDLVVGISPPWETKAGYPVDFVHWGRVLASVGAAKIPRGTRVGPGTDGKLIAATSGKPVVGVAVTEGAANGTCYVLISLS